MCKKKTKSVLNIKENIAICNIKKQNCKRITKTSWLHFCTLKNTRKKYNDNNNTYDSSKVKSN